MNSRPDDDAGPVRVQAGADGGYSVDVRGGMGVQVGEGNTQIIYTYNRLTWTDGVAPPPLVSVSGVVDSPYRGLGAFEEQDAAFFFGREEAATQLLHRLSRLTEGQGLLVVSGVSGAGKSSLLRAGMLPRIRGAGLASAPGAASWPCLVFTPGRAPLDELALRVGLLAGADAAAVRRGLDADPGGFALTARQAALAPPPVPGGEPLGPAGRPGGQRRLLLVVDQFEQVFTQCADEGQRRAFITALCAAASAAPRPDQASAALVVLGVRADFEARCANYPELAGAVQDRYLVMAMTERQLRMVITEPAKTAGSRVDEDLVEVLLAEVRIRQPRVAGAGVLPLLSHALDQAWRSRTGGVLTVADYERTGGIEGAVADSAQRAYDHLSPGQKAAARQVFTRLIAASSDGMDTADRSTRAELTEGKTPAQTGDVEAVLEAFAAERLLTLAADSVEISHEVLLTAWPLLRDTWLTETHADRIVRTRLHNVAADWARHSRDPSYLYGGSLLQAAAETAARTSADPARNPPLSQTERDFLQASNRARRRAARWRHAVIAGLLALTLTASITAGIAVHNAASATRQQAIALSRQLAAEGLAIASSDPVTAGRLAVAAWGIFPTDQARSLMTTLLVQQQQDSILPCGAGRVNGVAFSPDSRLLASADADGTVRLWNPATRQPAGAPLRAGSSVNAVAFSPDGRLLASADADGTVRLWNPATRQPAGAPLRAGSSVNAVAFSPDGRLLASADADGTVRLWNPATRQPAGAPLRTDPAGGGGVNAVAFSPDRRLLASGKGYGSMQLWNPATEQPVGAPLSPGSGSGSPANAVAFSPDGSMLASADMFGMVQLWNSATGDPVGVPHPAYSRPPPNSPLGPLADAGIIGAYGVAFSPDGTLLASGDVDGTVRLWNAATGQLAGAPIHTGSGVNAVAFSPDGRLLASAQVDGTVRLWNPVTRRAPGAPLPSDSGTGATTGVRGVAFSPDDRLLASADGDGTVKLWNPTTGQPVSVPILAGSPYPGGSVNEVAFGPNGRLLASAVDDAVKLWSPVTGQPVGVPIQANGGATVTGVAFSPDGKLLATSGADGTVRLWNSATGRPVGAPLRAVSSLVLGVAVSPDGKLLASAADDGTVRVWSAATGQPVGPPLSASSGSYVWGVAFSPVGRLLASADGDGTVRLWDPATGRPVGSPLRAGSSVNAVAFSPDGKLLASAGSDGIVRLWDPATGQPVGLPITAAVGTEFGVLGVAFSTDGKLLASADSDGTVRIWRVPLFVGPYAALCADVGPPTRAEWAQYAHGESHPNLCQLHALLHPSSPALSSGNARRSRGAPCCIPGSAGRDSKGGSWV